MIWMMDCLAKLNVHKLISFSLVPMSFHFNFNLKSRSFFLPTRAFILKILQYFWVKTRMKSCTKFKTQWNKIPTRLLAITRKPVFWWYYATLLLQKQCSLRFYINESPKMLSSLFLQTLASSHAIFSSQDTRVARSF